MAKRESYGPPHSPFKIVIYILVVIALVGGIGYLVKCTRARRADFQTQIQELGQNETEYVQVKTAVTEEETEVKQTSSESDTAKKQTATTEPSTETEQTTEGQTETESETVKASAADLGRHILLLNGSGKDGMAAVWKTKMEKAGYTNVSVASFPGRSIDQTRIYVEKEEEADAVKELFTSVEVTTDPFTADITLEDGSAPKDVDLYIIIGKNDVEE